MWFELPEYNIGAPTTIRQRSDAARIAETELGEELVGADKCLRCSTTTTDDELTLQCMAYTAYARTAKCRGPTAPPPSTRAAPESSKRSGAGSAPGSVPTETGSSVHGSASLSAARPSEDAALRDS